MSKILMPWYGLFFLLFAMNAQAAQKCPNKLTSYGNLTDTFECVCEATQFNGAVWGTGLYTTDSSVCQAALHAGVVQAQGGAVKLRRAQGCPQYTGSTSNGVGSQGYGTYASSYYFPAKGNGNCDKISRQTALQPCPTNMKDYLGMAGSLECNCAASEMNGSVYGTEAYTSDSSVCRAAVHAGVIPAAGGDIKVAMSKGCSSYAGTQNNTVSTSNWGAYSESFYFPSQADGTCPSDRVVSGVAPCPSNYTALYKNTQPMTCFCPGAGNGSVWGSMIYTHDSNLCKAAVHAGAIPATGGNVKVQGAGGCAGYVGSSQNGITTSRYGSYGGSYFFPDRSNGTCP